MKYYYHVDTRNESFLDMYLYLKERSVRNNKFFLKIYDSDLMDPSIDVSDESLPLELKAKIIHEIRNNYWYFIREVVRIPVTGGEVPYRLHIGNLALNWCLLRNLNPILVLPRQNFKTISVCCFYLWLFLFRTSNTECGFFNKSYDDCTKNLKRIKDLRDCLPPYLQFRSRGERDNITLLEHPTNGNKLQVLSSPQNAMHAERVGRGATQAAQWWDEIAFIKYLSIVYAAAAPANSQASIEAKRFGQPHHKVITTTPGDLRTPHGIYAKRMFDNAAPFDIRMFDWKRSAVDQYIEQNSTNDFVYIEFSYRELGRDSKWFRKQCRDLNNDQAAVNREILLKWSKASDDSPFTIEVTERLESSVLTPLGNVLIFDKYLLNIYVSNPYDRKVLIGVDPSDGLERDRTAIVVTDALDLGVVAELYNSKIGSVETVKILMYLGTVLFKNCVLVIENNRGRDIIRLLRETELANRIYFELKENKTVFKVNAAGKKERKRVRSYEYGVNCNAATRPQMIGLLNNIVNEDYDKLRARALIDDICGLVRKNNGRIEHSSVSFDDTLFAYLYTRWVWVYGKNLARFGILGDVTLTDKAQLKSNCARARMLTHLNRADVMFDKERNCFHLRGNDKSYGWNLEHLLIDQLNEELNKYTERIEHQREQLLKHNATDERRGGNSNRLIELFDSLYQ